jgi:hypothetical protein
VGQQHQSLWHCLCECGNPTSRTGNVGSGKWRADYFKGRALAAAKAAGPDLQWFVLDAIPTSDIDFSVLTALRDLRVELEANGVSLIIAGRRTEFVTWLKRIDIPG